MFELMFNQSIIELHKNKKVPLKGLSIGKQT